jgi:ABC-type lipoprotein release transport system permease subunit
MPKNNNKYISAWKIAQRLYFSEENDRRSSRPAIRVALGGIIIGVLVMIVAISVVVGFKKEVSQKVAGFGSHIQVVNFDNNSTYELQPICVKDSMLGALREIPHVTSVSTFATKPGIIKTDSTFQGVVFKGTDYWSYFEQNIVEGALPQKNNDVIISQELARILSLNVGDDILCYFMKHPEQVIHKETLFNAVWGSDCFSEINTLNVYVRWLREKLEEDPKNPMLIQTVWKVGYRFGGGSDK